MSEKKLREDGSVINDSHAEVIARKSLIRWIVNQLDMLARSGIKSDDSECYFTTTGDTAIDTISTTTAASTSNYLFKVHRLVVVVLNFVGL